MDLFLSPNGRISQATYWRGAIILFVISAVLAALAAYVSPFISFLALPFVWPWIAIHVKRFHDSGKSGWMTLLMVLVAIVLGIVLSMFLPQLFGVDVAAMQQEAMEAATNAQGDVGAIMEMSKRMSQAQLLPQIVSTLVTTGVIGAIMGLFKSDPGDNQFGPKPAA